MYSRRTFLRGSVAFALLTATGDALADDFVVVISVKNSETHLPRVDVRDAFIGQTKQWRSGAVVQPIIGEETSAEFAWLASRIFRLSPREVLTKMKQEIFRGEMKRPIVARDAHECFTAISRHDGGIGVVSGDAAKNPPAGISILVVDD
jgi:hypothetical protein